MKNSTPVNLVISSCLAFALALVIWSPLQSQSSGPMHEKMKADKKMEHCQEMMQQKQKMKEDMKVQNAELTAHVARMNSAPDNKKIGVMTALITHMVEQRIAMDARKAGMEEDMMKHMMQHMQMDKKSKSSSMPSSMSQCPMMKDMDDKTAEPHKHPKS